MFEPNKRKLSALFHTESERRSRDEADYDLTRVKIRFSGSLTLFLITGLANFTSKLTDIGLKSPFLSLY